MRICHSRPLSRHSQPLFMQRLFPDGWAGGFGRRRLLFPPSAVCAWTWTGRGGPAWGFFLRWRGRLTGDGLRLRWSGHIAVLQAVQQVLQRDLILLRDRGLGEKIILQELAVDTKQLLCLRRDGRGQGFKARRILVKFALDVLLGPPWSCTSCCPRTQCVPWGSGYSPNTPETGRGAV